MLDELEYRELICGFISGKEELLHWEPADLFQFYYDTTPVFGSLDELRSALNDETAARAVRFGACSLYRACVHNMLHEQT